MAKFINVFICYVSIGTMILPCYATKGDTNSPAAGVSIKQEAGEWWLKKPMRMIQTNLREIDVTLDVNNFMQHISKFKPDVVMINVGGIVANYPTELEYHYRNPLLRGDFVGTLTERLHSKGIRVIGRFDFSKINEELAGRKPEWLYKGVKGEIVNYNGQVHTCVSGGYQQEYLFKILGEAIDRYPLDGVFFNMIGYQTTDYSGNYHGICQCDACRERFRKWCGLELPAPHQAEASGAGPVVEDANDEAFRKYEDFCQKTSDELFQRVREFIKGRRSDIAVCTYTDAGVDIIREESNSAFDRPLPEWNYSATDNVRTAMCSWKNKAIGNVAINFPDYRCRHSAVSPYLTELRLVEDMLNGGWLDYCVIGTIENQEDRLVIDYAQDIFDFHSQNEKWLSNTKPMADVCLIKGANRDEYKGLFRILSENHILFDVISAKAMTAGETPRALEDYQVVILPDVRNMSDAFCARLDAYVNGGGKILATGRTSTCDEMGNPLGAIRLKSIGVKPAFKVHPHERGTYFRISAADKKQLQSSKLDELDIVYLNSEFLECEATDTGKGFFGFIPAAMFGPPEKCYYKEVTNIPGLFYNQSGKGIAAFFPWQIGEHYEKRSNHCHYRLVVAVLEGLLRFERSLVIEASELVEVNRRVSADGKFEWVGLINHTGQNGTAFHKPIQIFDTAVRVKSKGKVKRVGLLKAGMKLEFTPEEDGWIRCSVPKLGRFEIVVYEY